MRQKGQSFVETLIVLPIIVLLAAGVAQALWLLLTQQVLQAAAVHAIRAGALNGMDKPVMHEILLQRMSPITGKHVAPPRVDRLAPTDELVREEGERVDIDQQRYYELRSDFASVRLENYNNEEKERWLRQRIGSIRVIWCQPLQIPLAAQAIHVALQHYRHDAQHYCDRHSRNTPLLAIEATAAAQLVAPVRVAD